MQLFTLVNQQPLITTEALLIPTFKKVWDMDKSKDKGVAIKELAYVFLTTDYKSIYASFPTDIKIDTIKKDLFNGKYTPSKEVEEAVKKYEELQDTFNMRFLKSAKSAAEKTMGYFESIDYSERDIKGNLVYKVKEVTSSIKDCGGIIETLDKLMDKVAKEQKLQGSRTRGDGEGSFFESN
jgi:CRISPR/Cas system CSM-associated protein Csm2 small subunit